MDCDLCQHRRSAGNLAHEETARIADGFWRDVLKRLADLRHAVDMHAALVRERTLAHVGLVAPQRACCSSSESLVAVCRSIARSPEQVKPHFQSKVGDDGRKVRVAAALADPDKRALHLYGAGAETLLMLDATAQPMSLWQWMPIRCPGNALHDF